MPRWRKLHSLLICFVFAAAGQTPDPGSLTLTGTVINSQTGEPIRRALVSLTGPPDLSPEGKPSAVPRAMNTSTLTDSGGVFRFTALRPGYYFIYPSKPEFAVSGPGTNLSITLNESTPNVVLRLAPLGVIEGKVVDRDDLPLRDVQMVILSTRVTDGFRDTVVDRSVSTDDRGIFRIWSLQPGSHFLKAAGKSGGTAFLANDPASRLPVESFAPVYFGGGSSVKSSKPIELGPGADIQANFALEIQTGYRIRGTLANFLPHSRVRFTLLNGNEQVAAGTSALNVENGHFEISDVVPGSYVLRAEQGREMFGEAPVTVGYTDVNGLIIPMAGAVDIPYSVRITGAQKDVKGPDQDPNFSADDEPDTDCSVRLHSGQLRTGLIERPAQTHGPRKPNMIYSVSPGSYTVLIQCGGAYVTSATAGTQDLLANSSLTIQPGAVPPPIEVVAQRGGGSVSGKLGLNNPSTPQQPAGVLLVPRFAGTTGPAMAEAFAGGKEASFRFNSLAPGDYVAYGFSHPFEVEYRNPEFLKTLSGGVPVRVETDGTTAVTIDKVIQ